MSMNLGHSILIQYVRSIGGYFDKGNVHHNAVDFIVDSVANQTTYFRMLSFRKAPTDVSDDDTTRKTLTRFGVDTHQKN